MKILFITSLVPHPINNGGSQRSNLIHRVLRTLGEVDLVMVSTDSVTNREELRRDYGLVADFIWQRPGDLPPFRWFLKWKRELVHKAAQTLQPRRLDYVADPVIAAEIGRLIAERHYDVVVGRYLRPTMKSGAVGTGPAMVLDVDDLDTQVFLSRLNVPGRPLWERLLNRWHYRQIKKIIPEHLQKFDLVWVANEEEADSSVELKDIAAKRYLPNIPVQVADQPVEVDAPLPPLPPGGPPTILFVGNFWVLPNKLGVDHFVRHVWPKIHAAQPEAVFRIVGTALGDDLRAAWNAVPGVEAIGFVEDLSASYRDCSLAVVPLLSGAGTNIKVMEALRFGRPCVVTEYSHRGYGQTLRHGQELLVARNDGDFAECCLGLLRDPVRRETLARQGRAAVAQHFSFERFSRTISDSIQALLASREPEKAASPAGNFAPVEIAASR